LRDSGDGVDERKGTQALARIGASSHVLFFTSYRHLFTIKRQDPRTCIASAESNLSNTLKILQEQTAVEVRTRQQQAPWSEPDSRQISMAVVETVERERSKIDIETATNKGHRQKEKS
jgi:hypothetical protein